MFFSTYAQKRKANDTDELSTFEGAGGGAGSGRRIVFTTATLRVSPGLFPAGVAGLRTYVAEAHGGRRAGRARRLLAAMVSGSGCRGARSHTALQSSRHVPAASAWRGARRGLR
ncbi:hypothetical protein EVAR_55114_1 [Eumeta japonica]|uniref:Uncharacterized protein n=1 Tax=Eumeta variegata TaxID=151549 RepID=A0A4C1Y8R5_EUMVA|nr:hypothetical protein EVAR_55114_1 [Eumeta japonica]